MARSPLVWLGQPDPVGVRICAATSAAICACFGLPPWKKYWQRDRDHAGEPWLWSTVAPVVQQVCPPRRAVSSVAALPLWSRQAAFAEELARGPTIAHAATKQPLMGWTDCFSVDYPFAENPPGTKWLESASRASSHSITLLDLYRSVVDRRQHLRRIAGDDDVDHRRAVAFFHSSPQRAGQRFGILNADAAAAHRAGDRGVIHLDKVGRLIAAAHHRVLQRFDVTRRGVVDDNHREPEPGAARGFQLAEHHIEAAIARNCDDGPVRRGKARPHPARQSVANRRESTVRDEMPPGDFGVVEQAGPMTGKPAIGD